MSDMIAVVPVKGLSDAKSRLAGVLSPDDRRTLTIAMLEDVAEALLQSQSVDMLVIVSRDESLRGFAVRVGALVFAESQSGLNNALEEVCHHLAGQYSRQSTMIVPADVPLLTSSIVDEMVCALDDSVSPTVVATRSRDGGTNALLRRPPDAIPVSFGRGSFEIHSRSASERGVRFVRYQSDELALDIDTAEDLKALARSSSASRAVRLAKHLLKSKSEMSTD